MAELTPLDGKLGEVLGLAQLRRKRRPMSPGWKPPNNSAINSTDRLAGGSQDGDSSARAGDEDGGRGDAPDLPRGGFEFQTMAEAGELGHWEIVQTTGKTVGEDEVAQLADWAVEIQREHGRTGGRSTCPPTRGRRCPGPAPPVRSPP
jgi:hypothetical protein